MSDEDEDEEDDDDMSDNDEVSDDEEIEDIKPPTKKPQAKVSGWVG